MNSDINSSIVDPIINRIYGNTFKQQRSNQKPHNQQGFIPNYCDQQGLYCNPFNQTLYLKCGCDGLILYHKQVREVLMKYYDKRFNCPFIVALLPNQKTIREKMVQNNHKHEKKTAYLHK